MRHIRVQVTKVEKNPDGSLKIFAAHGCGKETKEEILDDVTTLIWAIGREPNLKALNIEKVGIEKKNGFIHVDTYQTTANPKIMAVGDVCGRMQLTPGLFL